MHGQLYRRTPSAATDPSIQRSHWPVNPAKPPACLLFRCYLPAQHHAEYSRMVWSYHEPIIRATSSPFLLACLPADLPEPETLSPYKASKYESLDHSVLHSAVCQATWRLSHVCPTSGAAPPPCQSRPCYCQCKPCLGRLPQACTLFPSLTTQCLCACACVYAWACLSQLCICFPYCSPPRSFQNHLW